MEYLTHSWHPALWEGKPWLVELARFCGTKTSSKANFKLPTWHQLLHKFPENLTWAYLNWFQYTHGINFILRKWGSLVIHRDFPRPPVRDDLEGFSILQWPHSGLFSPGLLHRLLQLGRHTIWLYVWHESWTVMICISGLGCTEDSNKRHHTINS